MYQQDLVSLTANVSVVHILFQFFIVSHGEQQYINLFLWRHHVTLSLQSFRAYSSDLVSVNCEHIISALIISAHYIGAQTVP